jgi:DNA-directed RNA polymerase specialized sigma24 family protein
MKQSLAISSSSTSEPGFQHFVARLRDPEQRNAAAVEFQQRYQQQIIRHAGTLLRVHRSGFTSPESIYQTVARNVLAGIANEDYSQLRNFEDLGRLVSTITWRKYCDACRKFFARPDLLADEYNDQWTGFRSVQASPEEEVMRTELAAQLPKYLRSDEERLLFALWMSELTWSQIALQLHRTPEACRKAFYRAVKEAAREMGLLDDV